MSRSSVLNFLKSSIMLKRVIGIFSIFLSIIIQSCDNCKIDPDLATELVGPTTDIIMGETVNWQAVAKSVEDNSVDCEAVNIASVLAGFFIDYFQDEKDPTGEKVSNNETKITNLGYGKEQKNSYVYKFNDNGIYLVTSEIDLKKEIKERNEDNNFSKENVDLRANSDVFNFASPKFKAILENCGAIVIVGKSNIPEDVTSYKGKIIYRIKG